MFAWPFPVPPVLLLILQCRVMVMWRLQTGFLRRTMVPAMESPSKTLTGRSSMNRVCFQCVGLQVFDLQSVHVQEQGITGSREAIAGVDEVTIETKQGKGQIEFLNTCHKITKKQVNNTRLCIPY